MRFPWSIRLWILVALAPFLISWVYFAIVYSMTPVYWDHNEPVMVVIAEQWLLGRPMYHSVDSPYQYSLVYGPAGYLWLAMMLSLFSDPVLASKLSGGFWSLSSLVLLIYVFRFRGGMIVALAGAGIVASELLSYTVLWPVFLWDRTDPILLFSTGLGLLALNVRNRGVGMFLLALAIALSTDCKIHACLYLLPSLILWLRREGTRGGLAVLAIAAVLMLIPFLLPNVSWENYIIRLLLAAHQPLLAGQFYDNSEMLFGLLLPIVFFSDRTPLRLSWSKEDEDALMFVALLLAGFLVCIPASKAGTGTTHLLPLFPYVGYLCCAGLAALPDKPKLNWVLCLGMIWVFVGYQKVIRTYASLASLDVRSAEFVQEEIRQALRIYPASQTQMGVAGQGGFFTTYYSPWLYRDGAPCVVNVGSYMDMKADSGLGPEFLKKSFEAEEFKYWLIPRDGPPFSFLSWCDSTPLFDASVAETFFQHYTRVSNTACFDVYESKGATP